MRSALPKIFADCCAREIVARWDLSRPFVEGDWVYATNARIAVRTKTETLESGAIPSANPNARRPKIGAIFDDAHAVERTTMPICKVDPRLPCNQCNEDGLRTYPLSPPTSCVNCGGDGWIGNAEGVKFGDTKLMSLFVGLIYEHGVRLIEVESDPYMPVAFSGDGFEGLLMPMK